MLVYCGNKTAINIAHNLVHHDKTKHVEIDKHLIKEKMDRGQIYTPYVASTKKLTDLFTKGLSSIGQAWYAKYLCICLRGSVEMLLNLRKIHSL